jgi:hypothetical protein
MITKESEKSHNVFICEKCDYKCCRKSDYNKHLTTTKHKNNDEQLHQTQKKYTCSCGKEYSFRQGLYLHKKKCKKNEENTVSENNNNPQTNEIQELKEFMKYLMKENSDLKNMMFDVIKNGTHNTTNNTNSHNKTFNLNVFLNETCKDAMNIMDFVDSIKVQLTDLEKVGKIGYVEGISNIIVKNLNSLDETKRPVHCTDSKREVMYVKDEDKWEKENENKQKLRKAIKHVAHKNSKMLKEFKTKYPDCEKSESKFSDQYNKLIVEAMGGKGDNDLEKEDKIIKNIAKEVIINKD